MVVFGCYCWVELGQPKPTATGLSISDYQKALDSIPEVFRFQHKYYKWRHDLGGEGGDWIKFSDTGTKRQVPGTSEPYYVEGPGNQGAWDWLRNLNGGFGGLGLSSWKMASVIKREMQMHSGTDSQPSTDAESEIA
ncbi:hypothetical protein ABW21_db0202659 [Orbilia brochopaga]|nr:hypothetical protein ABW21_db0202659 [Drechslerella brochopaga]